MVKLQIIELHFNFPKPKTEDEITDSVRQDNINFLEGRIS